MKVQDTLNNLVGHYIDCIKDGDTPHDAAGFTLAMMWLMMHPDTIYEHDDVTDEIRREIEPMVVLPEDAELTYTTIKIKPSSMFDYLDHDEELCSGFTDMLGPENAEAIAANEHVVMEETVEWDPKGYKLSDADRLMLDNAIDVVRERRTQMHGTLAIRTMGGGKYERVIRPSNEKIEQMLGDLDEGPKIVSDWARQLEEGGN